MTIEIISARLSRQYNKDFKEGTTAAEIFSSEGFDPIVEMITVKRNGTMIRYDPYRIILEHGDRVLVTGRYVT